MRNFALIFALIFISCSSQETAKPASQKTAVSSTTVESCASSESSNAEIFGMTEAGSDSLNVGISISEISSSDASSSSEGVKNFLISSSSMMAASLAKEIETVTVGNLRWMTRNMNSWTFSGSHCYQKKKQNCAKYGRLYNFETAKKICPNGWRLPTDEDWFSLTNALGENAGYKLKAKSGWQSDEDNVGNGSDEIGFGGIPTGINFDGNFIYEGFHTFFWTATEKDANSAFYRSLGFDSPEVYRFYNFKTAEYAVRCVQNVN